MGAFSFISSAFLKQVDTVTDNVSGCVLVGSAWVPVGLTTASEFATGLSHPLYSKEKEKEVQAGLWGQTMDCSMCLCLFQSL